MAEKSWRTFYFQDGVPVIKREVRVTESAGGF